MKISKVLTSKGTKLSSLVSKFGHPNVLLGAVEQFLRSESSSKTPLPKERLKLLSVSKGLQVGNVNAIGFIIMYTL